MKYTLLRGTASAVAGRRWLGVPAIRFFLILFSLASLDTGAQINASEQINMPGAWTGWAGNPPTSALALCNSSQTPGGRIQLITTGARRYQTQFSVAASGADLVGGSYEWLFTSGPNGGTYNNKWSNTNVSLNTLQTYTFQGGPNNNITINNGKWYTMNWMDNGYNNTEAIFMETSAQPVTINSVSQSPLNGSVNNMDAVTVTINTSASPSVEEIVYLRYTTDNFVTSNLVPFSFTGSVGTAQIPGQGYSTNVAYYVFSTTVTNPSPADADKVTINLRNANPGNFSYTVNGVLPPVNVTFQVNMTYQTVSGGVNISGSFSAWSLVPMTNMGNGIWQVTLPLDQGMTYYYKYVNGAGGYEPNLLAPCWDGEGNRAITVGNFDQTLNPVCFGSCFNCNSPAQVTFQVNLTGLTVSNPQIYGSFLNNWSTPAALTNMGNGIYAATVTVEQGTTYEYKFRNGGFYEGSISAPCGNGSNRVLAPVEGGTYTVPVVCFNSCTDCTPRRAITFRVNMSTTTVSGNGVRLAGSFGGAGYPNWDPSGIALTDANSDGIYDVTLNLPEGTNYEYKFVNGNAWGSEESVPGECNSFGNRTLSVGTSNQLLPVVCFASCSNCPAPPGNDFYLGAQPMITPNYPSQINSSGTLALCTVSPETSYYPAQPGAGQDAWYRFKVPNSSSGRMRIQVSSTNDVAIILQKVESFSPFYSAVAQTNDVTGGGVEIMNTGALIPDAWYRIAVKNMGLDTPTSFTISVSNIRTITCASGASIPKTLCQSFSVSYTGASSYTYTFTDASAPTETYTKTITGSPFASSSVFLSTVPGLRYGRVYNVEVDAVYTLANGAGSPTVLTLSGASVCQLTTVAQPASDLTLADRCPSNKIKSSIISTNWVCGVIDYVWGITPVTGLQTEYLTTRGAADRFIRVGNLNGINSGATQYNVRVKPVFSDGAGGRREGDWGTSYLLCLASPIAMVENKEDAQLMDVAEKVLVDSEITGFSVYPNPTNGAFVRLNIESIKSPFVQVSVTDMMGRTVFNRTYSASGFLNADITELANASSGVYLFRVNYNGETREQRLLITE